MTQLAASYHDERDEVEKAAAEVTASVVKAFSPPTAEGSLEASLVSRALHRLEQQFDEEHGGLEGAPKFPPHGALALLFHACREAERPDPAIPRSSLPRSTSRRIIAATLDAMALGGVHDHIGGGFHRYATDAAWFLPHFEKMLYDNALLAQSYVDGFLLTGDPFYRGVAEGIFRWVVREMTGLEGAFNTGMDAESEGEEGKFYLWRRDEITDVLGQQAGELFCRGYQVTEEGNYREEHGGAGGTHLNVIYLRQRPAELAESAGGELAPSVFEERMARARDRLLAARDQRVKPFTDDKVLTAWNGLMISSLAYAGRALANPAYLDSARRAAGFVLAHLRSDGRPATRPVGKLRRRWREGEVGRDVFLDDYAHFITGLLELHEATGDRDWLDTATELMDDALTRFRDEGRADFFFTPRNGESLFVRPKEVLDQPIPSSSGVISQALVRLGVLTGEARYREAAEQALLPLSGWVARMPRGAETIALAVARYLQSSLPAR